MHFLYYMYLPLNRNNEYQMWACGGWKGFFRPLHKRRVRCIPGKIHNDIPS